MPFNILINFLLDLPLDPQLERFHRETFRQGINLVHYHQNPMFAGVD